MVPPSLPHIPICMRSQNRRKGYFLWLIIDLANDKLDLGFQGACPLRNFALVAALPNYCD